MLTRRGFFGFIAGAAALAAVPAVALYRQAMTTVGIVEYFGGLPVVWLSEDELLEIYPDNSNDA